VLLLSSYCSKQLTVLTAVLRACMAVRSGLEHISSAAPYTLSLTYSRVAAAQPTDPNYYEALSEFTK